MTAAADTFQVVPFPSRVYACARRRSRFARWLVAVAALCACAVAASSGTGEGASVIVSTSVLSASSLSTTGCPSTSANVTSFGAVSPGSNSVTSANCTLSFGSSNSTSMLRVSQTDGVGTAMGRGDPTFGASESHDGIADIASVDANEAWAVSSWGATLHRTGGSTTWTSVANPGTAAGLYSVAAPSSTLAFASGDGAIYRWNGATWSTWATTLPAGTRWTSIAALDVNHVWVAGAGKVYFYDGATWTNVTAPGMSGYIDQVRATASGTTNCAPICVYVTAGGTLWSSTTGGTSSASWSLRTFPPAWTWIIDVAIAPYDGLRIWAVDGANNLQVSVDGGLTWGAGSYGVGMGEAVSVARDAATPATTTIYAGGSDGRLYRSTNGAGTWTSLTAPQANLVQRLSAPTSSVALSAGTGMAIGGTTNGTTWTRHTVPGYTSDLRSIAAVDASRLVAVGNDGTVRTSADAGTSWSTCGPCPSADLNGVAVGGSTVFAVGSGGTLLHSTNAGSSWTTDPAPGGITTTLWGVAASDATHAWAVGDNGTILQWNGTVWSNLGNSGTTQMLRSVATSDGVHLFVGGLATLLASSNGGGSWSVPVTPASMPAADFVSMAVSGANPTTAFAAGDWGVLWKTTDGINWTSVNLGNANYTSGVATNGDTIMVIGRFPPGVRSLDGGVTWQPFGTNMWWRSTALVAIDSNTEVAVGVHGNIYHALPDGTAPAQVPDWNPGVNDWSHATNAFGACLLSVTGANVTNAWGATGSCTNSDADPWNAIPQTSAPAASKVALTTTAGALGTANLRFGFKTTSSLPAGDYAAQLTFTVIAPDGP